MLEKKVVRTLCLPRFLSALLCIAVDYIVDSIEARPAVIEMPRLNFKRMSD